MFSELFHLVRCVPHGVALETEEFELKQGADLVRQGVQIVLEQDEPLQICEYAKFGRKVLDLVKGQIHYCQEPHAAYVWRDLVEPVVPKE